MGIVDAVVAFVAFCEDIIGLTMRVGRHVCGNAEMIKDVLFQEDASILFLGEPGSGKTTVVREAARLLAEVRASY